MDSGFKKGSRVLIVTPEAAYLPKLSGLPVAENIKIALAFQREIINRIIPEVQPDLIHCFDWMTGLLPAAVRGYWISCLFTLYNLNSAKATLAALEDRGIDAESFWQNCYFDQMPGRYEDIRDTIPLDFFASGIFASHAVNMVSTALSRYVLSKNENNLAPGLRCEIRNKHTAGCLHAFDHAPGPIFDPAADRFLCQQYTPANHRLGKAMNKLCFQDKLHLPLASTAPLDETDGMIHRSVANQKTQKTVVLDHLDKRVPVGFHLHPNDSGTRRHDEPDRTIRQAENAFDHFLFLGNKNARLGPRAQPSSEPFSFSRC